MSNNIAEMVLKEMMDAFDFDEAVQNKDVDSLKKLLALIEQVGEMDDDKLFFKALALFGLGVLEEAIENKLNIFNNAIDTLDELEYFDDEAALFMITVIHAKSEIIEDESEKAALLKEAKELIEQLDNPEELMHMLNNMKKDNGSNIS